MKFNKGFTLLEMLLVLTILGVLFSLVFLRLKPDEIVQDSYETEREGKKQSIYKALRTYSAQNHGDYPIDMDSLLPDTNYSICKYGMTCSGVDLDELVDAGFLAEIPVDPDNDTETDSGYYLAIDDTGDLEIGAADDEALATPTPPIVGCASGYIEIPGSATYGTSDFCVMKYEARNVGGVATSQTTGTPWEIIDRPTAISECTALGEDYHIPTNEEWMTIARNVEQVASNWTSGSVGTGAVFSGHNDNSPANTLAASTDNDGYNGTGDLSPSGQRRTLTLSNSEVIWDFAGNIREWINEGVTCAASQCTSSEMPYDSTPGSDWVSPNNLVTFGAFTSDLLRPSNTSWGSTNGMGRIGTDFSSNTTGGLEHAFVRGGSFSDGDIAGIYSLNLFHGSNMTSNSTGFRCAMSL